MTLVLSAGCASLAIEVIQSRYEVIQSRYEVIQSRYEVIQSRYEVAEGIPGGKPVAEIRVGRITATIWQNNPTDEGVSTASTSPAFSAAAPPGIALPHSAAMTF